MTRKPRLCYCRDKSVRGETDWLRALGFEIVLLETFTLHRDRFKDTIDVTYIPDLDGWKWRDQAPRDTPMIVKPWWLDEPGAMECSATVLYEPDAGRRERLAAEHPYTEGRVAGDFLTAWELARDCHLSSRGHFPLTPTAAPSPPRILLVGGAGGPYWTLSKIWYQALAGRGAPVILSLGDLEDLAFYNPSFVLVLYIRAAFNRSRSFLRELGRLRIPWVALSLEDPYESRTFARMFSVTRPAMILSTDPLVVANRELETERGRSLPVEFSPLYYLAHPWNPAALPTPEDERWAAELWDRTGGWDAVLLGQAYGSRIEEIATYPGIWSRYRWVTIGMDWNLNTTGITLRYLPLGRALAVAARAVLVNLHRDATTAGRTYRAEQNPENMNWTTVQAAAAGVFQIASRRQAIHHHLPWLPTFRNWPELERLILEARRSPGWRQEVITRCQEHVEGTFPTHRSVAGALYRRFVDPGFVPLDHTHWGPWTHVSELPAMLREPSQPELAVPAAQGFPRRFQGWGVQRKEA